MPVTNGSGDGTLYSYSPYGEPDATRGWTGSRFRYTGQIMLPEAQLYHYKARVYDPSLGRFLQTACRVFERNARESRPARAMTVTRSAGLGMPSRGS